MKSIKQSRLDRLARRDAEKAKLTKKQKSKRDIALFAKIKKTCLEESKKTCRHGVGFSGYDCFVCRPNEIADRLRSKWSGAKEYGAYIYLGEGEGETCLRLRIKTAAITKKLREMQDNGFWYPWNGKPVFMMPGKIRVVMLDKETSQSPWSNDPSGISSSEVSEASLSSEQ